MSISRLYISESESEVAQSCRTLCDPMDCSLPGFSVHGIFQARVLEWIAISFSRGSSRPRDRTWISHIGGRRFNLWATREAHKQSPNLEAHDTIIINLKDVLNRRKNKEEKKKTGFLITILRQILLLHLPLPLLSTPRPLTSNNCATLHKLVSS